MRIGVPKEIKTHEYRVGLTPTAVREVCAHGHTVLIQTGAGAGIDADDAAYRQAGATIADTAEAVFAAADMIVKVKEPQPAECALMRPDQVLFTYLHLAADPPQARALQESGCTAVAYETVTGPRGGLPLLAPMSEVAGRMAVQAGAHCLEKAQGGRGVLLGGVPGVPAAKVVILGGGVVGTNAARMAMGLEAHVTVIDKNVERLRALDELFGARISTLYATVDAIEQEVLSADLVVGAVLVPGDSAPRLVSRAMVGRMLTGAVLVDVAIDQGGCFETSRATTHDRPTYEVDGVVHYCVANMPGAVARTSTYALNNVTLPFVLALADKGPTAALRDDPHLRAGLNVMAGKLTHDGVAHALGESATAAETMLAA
ncbi:alanine dehydrogenase [Roseospira goensis]|uniref:Alanine dehydrogenase n=1 Tax=Roseospira goensis TaxID=391922 RepID=A0A7W6RWL1_9PROT|nr:alanine dehydrogenase [Roseospira goensis]MBB4284555.1 alanine dehydrogenase [Roseospira goensis]